MEQTFESYILNASFIFDLSLGGRPPLRPLACHENHKIECGHATVLRLSAIYGANGAGKSNLLTSIGLLKNMVESESLTFFNFPESPTFRFDEECLTKPSGIAIEFFAEGNVFYYHIEFDTQSVVLEELYLSKKNEGCQALCP